MRSDWLEVGALIVAVVSIATALVPNFKTKNRLLMIAFALVTLGLTGIQYYLVSYTGRGLFERAACVFFPDGSYCVTQATISTPVTQVYAGVPPDVMKAGEQWGMFGIDSTCRIRFGTQIIEQNRWEESDDGRRTCSSPIFIPSMGGSQVAVFTDPPDVYPVIYQVDTLRQKIHRVANPAEAEVVKVSSLSTNTGQQTLVYTRLSSGEHLPKDGPGGGYKTVWGERPCVYDSIALEVLCMPTNPELIEKLRAYVSTQESCVIECFLSTAVRHQEWSSVTNDFHIYFEVEVRESPTYKLRRAISWQVTVKADGTTIFFD